MSTKDDPVVPVDVEAEKTDKFKPPPALLNEATPPSVRVTAPAVPTRGGDAEDDDDSFKKGETTRSSKPAPELLERVREKDEPERK